MHPGMYYSMYPQKTIRIHIPLQSDTNQVYHQVIIYRDTWRPLLAQVASRMVLGSRDAVATGPFHVFMHLICDIWWIDRLYRSAQ